VKIGRHTVGEWLGFVFAVAMFAVPAAMLVGWGIECAVASAATSTPVWARVPKSYMRTGVW
jgi:hypothetical protein